MGNGDDRRYNFVRRLAVLADTATIGVFALTIPIVAFAAIAHFASPSTHHDGPVAAQLDAPDTAADAIHRFALREHNSTYLGAPSSETTLFSISSIAFGRIHSVSINGDKQAGSSFSAGSQFTVYPGDTETACYISILRISTHYGSFGFHCD